MSDSEGSGVQVLDRAVALLDAVAGGGRSLAELAGSAGLPRPTAFRLLGALVKQGLLCRDPSGDYLLGRRAFHLGALVDQGLLRGLAARAVDLLHAATGESAHAYRRVGAHRECVAGVNKISGLRSVVHVGHLEPLGADAVGVALGARRTPGCTQGTPGAGWMMSTRAHLTCLAVPVAPAPDDGPVLVVAVSGGPDLARRADGVGRRLLAAAALVERGLRTRAHGAG